MFKIKYVTNKQTGLLRCTVKSWYLNYFHTITLGHFPGNIASAKAQFINVNLLWPQVILLSNLIDYIFHFKFICTVDVSVCRLLCR